MSFLFFYFPLFPRDDKAFSLFLEYFHFSFFHSSSLKREGGGLCIFSIGDASAIGVEGVVLLVADVDGLLLDRLGPGEGELPGKVHVAVEDVREGIATLSPGEPPGDERVPLVDVLADDEGTPGEHDDDKRDPSSLHLGEHLLVHAAESHGGAVVRALCARLLSNDSNNDIVALSTLTSLKNKF